VSAYQKTDRLAAWFGVFTPIERQIMSTSLNRRALVARAAVLPAIAIPVLAGNTDPIFAVIERRREVAAAALRATAARDHHLEDTLPKEDRTWHGRVDTGIDYKNNEGKKVGTISKATPT
jgi:hypothetical protein